MILDEKFGRVVLLSLPDADKRRERAIQELKSKGLSEKVEVITAVRGTELRPPAWWRAGTGAWGCFCTHRRELERAWQDGVESIVLIEDDAVWQEDAALMISEFLPHLPEDWGQLYFGGQHRKHPDLLPNGIVVRGNSINRTHAYAVSRKYIPSILAHIQYTPDYIPAPKPGKRPKAPHIDHQLEVAHQRKDWPVFAPSFWFAGQGENRSSINNRDHVTQWWHWEWNGCARNMPVVMIPEGIDLPEWAHSILHFGGTLDPGTMIDKGNREAANEAEALGRFIRMISSEAYGRQRLPALVVLHGEELVRRAWSGREVRWFHEFDAESLLARTNFRNELWHRHPWLGANLPIEVAENEEQIVPDPPGFIRRVHQVWIGEKQIPTRLAAYCETIRKAFPEWQYRMWSEGDMEELAIGAILPSVVTGKRVVDMGVRVDVVRLEILRQYGGIYLDVDFEALRPDLRPLFARRHCFYYADERVAFPLNSLLGVHEPGHGLVELYLNRIAGNLRNKKKMGVHWTSGPHQFNATLGAWTCDEWTLHEELVVKNEVVAAVYGGGSLVGFYDRVACPYAYGKGTFATFDPASFPNAWLAHHWAESWHKH